MDFWLKIIKICKIINLRQCFFFKSEFFHIQVHFSFWKQESTFFWYRRHIRQNFRYFHWKFYFQGKTYLNFLEILNLIWEILIHKPYSGKFFMVKWIRYSCWKVGKISKKYQKIPKNLEPEYRSLGTCIQGKKKLCFETY